MNTSINYTNNELLKITNIRYNLVYLYSDALLKGNINMIHSLARDASVLNTLGSILEYSHIYELTNHQISDAIYKGREYIGALDIRSNIDFFNATYIDVSCPKIAADIPNVITKDPSENPNLTDIFNIPGWHTNNLYITEVGQTVILNVGFRIEDVDVDTVMLEVQGDNPLYTTTGNGYHMVGSTLYWHDAYRLRPGMQIKIRWREEFNTE